MIRLIVELKHMKNLFIGACMFFFLALVPASSKAQSSNRNTLLETFSRWFAGDFNTVTSKGFVDTSSYALNLHHLVLKSWKSDDSTLWVYEEINFVNHNDQVFRQLVWSLKADPEGNIIANQYLLQKGWLFTGAWKSADRLRQLSSEYLASSPFCELVFTRVNKFYFKGSSLKNGCPNNYKNAVFFSDVFNLTQLQLDFWDRGWDASGKLVWGSAKEGIHFIRKSITAQPFEQTDVVVMPSDTINYR